MFPIRIIVHAYKRHNRIVLQAYASVPIEDRNLYSALHCLSLSNQAFCLKMPGVIVLRQKRCLIAKLARYLHIRQG